MFETHLIACTGDGGTRIETRHVAPPAEGEILLRMRRSGLCGTDLYKLRHHTVQAGTVLGHEIVGDVVAAGRGVRQFREGDRVAAAHHAACGDCRICRGGSPTLCAAFREDLLDPGGFSTIIRVKRRAVEGSAYAIPETLPDLAALFIEPAATVIRSITRGSADRDGIEAAILGGGSMGLLHLLVLRALRPEAHVTVIEPMEERRRIATALGADRVVTPSETERAELRADVAFDTVGGAERLQQALSCTREGGTVVLFAHAADDGRASFPLNDVFKSERRIVASYSGSREEQRIAYELLVSGALDPAPLVTHELPLDRFDDGLRLVTEQKALKVAYLPGAP